MNVRQAFCVERGGAAGYHDSRRHASAMLRIVAVLSSLNCILRRNYLAKDRRAQNALLVSWYPTAPPLSTQSDLVKHSSHRLHLATCVAQMASHVTVTCFFYEV